MSVVEQSSASNPGGTASTILSSDWTGLSRHLIASFFPVESYYAEDAEKTKRWRRVPDSVEVQAPLTDGTMDTTLNWHSPFENTGPDQKFSSFSALLQSGGITSLLQAIKELVPAGSQGFVQKGIDSLKALEGKTGFTKLNSTQIFNGMPPVKISATAHFRALNDAVAEVRQPINQLMSWALPRKLSPDGLLVTAAKGDPSLFPSEIPQIIGMQYADMSLMPLVIEAIPIPLTGPRDRNGVQLSAQITLSIASLSAIDQQDWNNSFIR